MNFRFKQTFSLLLNFIIGVFFLLLGIGGLILPWLPKMRKHIAHFFLENTISLSLFGIGALLMGLSIIFYTVINTRRRYINVRTGNQSVLIDEQLVHHYLEIYWKEKFPQNQIPFELTIKKKLIQVVIDLPAFPHEQQKQILEQIKDDFSELFSRTLGYPYDIDIYASFKTDQNRINPI